MRRFQDLVVAFFSLVLLSACNASGGTTPISSTPLQLTPGSQARLAQSTARHHRAAEFAYVIDEGGGDISGYTIKATTGALAQVKGSPFGGESEPDGIAVDPAGKFIYVSNGNGNDVAALVIDTKTGALTTVKGSPFAGGSSPSGVAITPTGKFVFVANNESGNVWVYSVATSGALKPVKGSPFVTVAHPSGIAVDPTGKFAYVASAGYGESGKVSGYSINATTGALAPVKGSPFQAGTTPYGVAVDPTSKFVYVTNYGSEECFRLHHRRRAAARSQR